MSTQPEADLAKLVNDEINRQVDIKMQPAPPIELIVKNLNIWAELKEGKPCRKHIVNKLIINSISCCFKAGTATAILGSSGSGKTTLMNYIASRMEDSVLKSNGQLFVNGNTVNSIKSIKHRTAYVTQFDVLFAEMTPREQMLYSARLSGLDNPEEKVEEIIEALNLNGCANTPVGDDLHRGVSGGERKRTAVGIELITDPSLLFLDEPTTGLDSKSALDIAFMIKTLTKTGRTVISTIHSPSAEIMEQFDQVICLCRGEIVYYGPPLEINSYFGEIGYPAPPLTNPADHLMTIIHEDDIKIQALKTGKELPEEEVQALFKERINTFVSSCKASNVDPVPVQDKPISYQEVTKERIRNTTEFKNFFIVLQRCIVLYRKSPTLFRVKMFQHVGFGCFALILLHNTVSPYHNTIQAIADKGGMAFNLGATMCFAGLFASLHTFIHAIPVFKREQENKLYGPFTFYVTNSLYELPFQMVMTVIYLLMVFWVINIRHDTFWTFVRYFFLFTLTKLSSAGLGDLLALVFKKIEIVQQVNSLAVVPMFLVSGFAANVKTISWHMIVYSYLSFFRFAFQGAINIEFDDGVRQDWIYNCRLLLPNCNDKNNDACYIRYKDHPTAVRPPACDPRTNYDFFENQYGWNLLILAGQAVFFRIFALWAVYLFVKERNVVQNEIPEDLAKVIENRRHMKYNTSPPKGGQHKQIKAVEVSPERNDEITPLNAVSPSPGAYPVKKMGKPSENSEDPEPRF